MMMQHNPILDWSDRTPIPLGRYESHETTVLYDRPEYIVWMMSRVFVYDKYPALYTFLLAKCSESWFAERLFENADACHRQRVRGDL
ncbi:hypothetical protein N9H70_08325 [Pseudomonadales bacterium]|jgi:hypothetical protein|nr:hypothetical protein [Pseudomonadales bacterium]